MISLTETSAEYHANPAIGSSDIRDFIRSPRLFADYREGVADRVETPALRFGSLAHMAILEPKRFHDECVVKPDGMSFATKEGKLWRDENAGKSIISAEEKQTLEMMTMRVPTEIRLMLASGNSEVTVRTTIGTLDVQCRPDHWNRPGRVKYDLKTCRMIEGIDKAIYNYGYHIQQQWYSRVIAAETGEKAPMSRIIFVESKTPWRWRVVDLDLDYMMIADTAIDQAISGLQARMKSGCWDDPSDIFHMASPPSYAMDDESEDEEF